MSDRYFLDTNIFVYCFDSTDSAKRRKANDLVRRALSDHLGVISSQVVQEFLNVALRKFTQPMSEHDAHKYVDRILAPLCDVFVSLDLLKQAVSIQAETSFSFYDSLILAGAVSGGCRTVFSEDLQAGQKVRDVIIKNPFV